MADLGRDSNSRPSECEAGVPAAVLRRSVHAVVCSNALSGNTSVNVGASCRPVSYTCARARRNRAHARGQNIILRIGLPWWSGGQKIRVDHPWDCISNFLCKDRTTLTPSQEQDTFLSRCCCDEVCISGQAVKMCQFQRSKSWPVQAVISQ
jgi:hypothetical protein